MKTVSDYIEIYLSDNHENFLKTVNLKPGTELWSKTSEGKRFSFLLTEEKVWRFIMITLALIVHSFRQRDPGLLIFCVITVVGDMLLFLPVFEIIKILKWE